jgi:uncharacterized protein (DUF433 family)
MISEKDLIPGYKWIVLAKGFMGGNPAILGKRISVDLILTFVSQGMTLSEIATEYELPIEAIQEAIRYARNEVQKGKLT